jgi:predicted lipoprotein with Yx(FWY)xxD motif
MKRGGRTAHEKPTRSSRVQNSIPSRTPGLGFVNLLAGLLAATALAACGSGAPAAETALTKSGPPASPTVSAATRRSPHLPIVVRSTTSRFGQVLVDARGRTLYLFTHDTGPASTCAGACARAWPPYLVPRRGRAGSGARSSLVGVTRRGDGARQLTYSGHPLYHYIGDRSPGDILCQDVEEYGGHWWVVSPAGKAVTAAGSGCVSRG